MSTLIFNIKTVGEDFESFDEKTKESLTRFIKREPVSEQERLLKNVKDGLGFSPLTGKIVAVGVFDAEKEKGAVYFDAKNSTIAEKEENGMKFKPMGEKEMLEHFWRSVSEYETLVSFNGRGFDVPFLKVRSAVHGIRPSKNLMSNRYLGNQDYDSKHIDLMDQLSFYGAARRKGNLQLWCRVFGIVGSKTVGIAGAEVKRLCDEERFEDIAQHNAGDLIAMRALYQHWQKNMAF